MFQEILKLTNTLAKLDRALTESEHGYYDAALRYAATVLRSGETEARLNEILVERQLDELSDPDGNRTA